MQLREPTGTIVLERTKNGHSRSVLITGLLLALLQQRHKQQHADSLADLDDLSQPAQFQPYEAKKKCGATWT
jgi:hypothetical protein